MLINCTNHPFASWSPDQLKEANRQFVEVLDLPFPQISPQDSTEKIKQIGEDQAKIILDFITDKNKDAVLVMGEMSLVYSLVKRLRLENIRCVATTSHRNTIDLGSNEKISRFEFIQFRDYE